MQRKEAIIFLCCVSIGHITNHFIQLCSDSCPKQLWHVTTYQAFSHAIFFLKAENKIASLLLLLLLMCMRKRSTNTEPDLCYELPKKDSAAKRVGYMDLVISTQYLTGSGFTQIRPCFIGRTTHGKENCNQTSLYDAYPRFECLGRFGSLPDM